MYLQMWLAFLGSNFIVSSLQFADFRATRRRYIGMGRSGKWVITTDPLRNTSPQNLYTVSNVRDHLCRLRRQNYPQSPK